MWRTARSPFIALAVTVKWLWLLGGDIVRAYLAEWHVLRREIGAQRARFAQWMLMAYLGPLAVAVVATVKLVLRREVVGGWYAPDTLLVTALVTLGATAYQSLVDEKALGQMVKWVRYGWGVLLFVIGLVLMELIGPNPRPPTAMEWVASIALSLLALLWAARFWAQTARQTEPAIERDRKEAQAAAGGTKDEFRGFAEEFGKGDM